MFHSHTPLKTAAIVSAFLLTAALFTGCGEEEVVKVKGNENLLRGKAAYTVKDYKTAAMNFAIAAHEGDAEAQYMLFGCFDEGNGVEPDKDEGLKWLRKSSDQGYAKAQMTLATYYEFREKDAKKAESLYQSAVSGLRKAVKDGDIEAYTMLAGAYNEGKGIKKDQKEAMKLLQKAAEMGDAMAKEILETMDKK